MATPPTKDEILELLRQVTPPEYHEPFFDDPRGAIAQYRAWARAQAELAKVVERSTSRQLFLAGPDRESAGFSTRATMQVTVRRTVDLDRPLIIAAGLLSVAGPRGRVYRSTAPLIWYPFDPEPELTVTLECDLIGEYGNLDFLADSNGNLTDPQDDTTPALDIVDLENLSQGRAGTRGVLQLGEGIPSKLVDRGVASTFGPSDVGLYLRITYAGDTDNIGRVLRIVDYQVDDLDAPTELYPRTIFIDDGPQPHLVSAAIQDDGGVFTDYTDEARSRSADDLPLLPSAPAVNDAVYFIAAEPYTTLRLFVTTERLGELELTWEIWDGAWQAIEVSDPSDGFALIGEHDVRLGDTTGWTATSVDGKTGYALRARVSAFTSQTNQPFAALAAVLIEAPLVEDPLDALGLGQIGWTLLDWRDLGVEIVAMTAPSGGREDELALKLAERGLSRRHGESIQTLRRRASQFPDVVTPEMIEWEINRILEPLGLGGKVIEAGDGFTGLFWDVPEEFAPLVVGAWDLYGDGDLFPEDWTMLPLDSGEEDWHFFVVVPPPTLGDFGAAWDDGPPPIYVEGLGQFIGNAWDECFVDGYEAVSALLYRQVYEVVDKARAAGIRFTMVVGDVPLCG